MTFQLKLLNVLIILIIAFCSGCGSSGNDSRSLSSVENSNSSSSSETHNPGYGTMFGTVLDKNQIPVYNALVEFSPAKTTNWGSYAGLTNSSGHYYFEAPSGTGTMKVTSPMGEMLYDSIPATIIQDGSTLINFPGGQKGTFTLAQINSDIEGIVAKDSQWGSAAVTIPSPGNTMYFNLVFNGDWVIENGSIEPGLTEQIGESITIYFMFDLGVSDATDITFSQCAIDISSAELSAAPSANFKAFIGEEDFIFGSGAYGVSEENEQQKYGPADLKDGAVPAGKKDETSVDVISRDIYGEIVSVNQDCGRNECALAAVSNSLRYLKKKYNLNIPESFMTIDNLRAPLKWTPTGVDVNKWINYKRDYARNYVKTDTTKDPGKAKAALDAGKDVEIVGEQLAGSTAIAHVAMIASMTQLSNGDYSITIIDDSQQGVEGKGVRPRVIIYHTVGTHAGTIEGFLPLIPISFKKFVIESPN